MHGICYICYKAYCLCLWLTLHVRESIVKHSRPDPSPQGFVQLHLTKCRLDLKGLVQDHLDLGVSCLPSCSGSPEDSSDEESDMEVESTTMENNQSAQSTGGWMCVCAVCDVFVCVEHVGRCGHDLV